MNPLRRFGPGLIITAAFIGPGTVTTASQAGASFGFALMWSVIFAIVATIILQEMAARLGIVSRHGLGQAVRATFTRPVSQLAACGLVVLAIGFGNAAYQTGNLTGATQGLTILSDAPAEMWTVLLAAVAFGLLLCGRYKVIERVLIVLVVLMSLVFLLTAILVRPDPGELLQGLFYPTVTVESLTTVIALIGTTVVPYNLFLHADSVREKWDGSVPVAQALDEARADTVLSISVGGLITLAIITTAAAAYFGRGGFQDLAAVADQLEPLLGGTVARAAFALGLFAAGLTSAITAPLAAAYAVSGVLGWKQDLRSWRFRAVWMIILLTGLTCALVFGRSPAQTIVVAQVANGLLLPVIGIFLLIVVNRSQIMGNYRNRLLTNVAGGVVVMIASGLGLWKIWGEIVKLVS